MAAMPVEQEVAKNLRERYRKHKELTKEKATAMVQQDFETAKQFQLQKLQVTLPTRFTFCCVFLSSMYSEPNRSIPHWTSYRIA